MKTIIYLSLLLIPILTLSQVGINTTTIDNSATLQLNSPNKALLLPRVELLSKQDITTIPNPANGLIVLNTKDSNTTVTEQDKVYGNVMYIFNGNKWQTIMTDDTPISTLNLPKIYARGKKGDTENTECTTPNSQNNGVNGSDFRLTSIENLTNKGVIVADKAGFYKFTIKATVFFKPSTLQTPVLSYVPPVFAGNALTLRFRGTGSERLDYHFSASGVVYLAQNETSGRFVFTLGGSGDCVAGDLLKSQEVIWEYLGK